MVAVSSMIAGSAANVTALAPLRQAYTRIRCRSGIILASLYFLRQLVQLMPAVQQPMCESLRLMAEQPWARWLDIKVNAAGRPLSACCLDMNKVFNNPSLPARIKVVFDAQCQWLWLGHCTGAEHVGGAGAWQALVSQQPPAARHDQSALHWST
ncbi:hypothetical protein V8C86DRAFT_2439952 [Haematococcus lacustris]